jgi:hypothetical protein
MKKLVFYLTSALLLNSCAMVLKVENMSVNNEAYIFKSTGKSVAVSTNKEFDSHVFGRRSEDPFKEMDFNQALIESIEHSRIFSVKPTEADYEIIATMVHWFQPPAGLDYHTDFRVKYTIKQHDKIIFEKEIESHSVATWKDSATRRVEISFERAIKQNIEMFIQEILKIEF